MKKKKNLFGGAGMIHGIGIRHPKNWILPVMLVLVVLFPWSGKGYAFSNFLNDFNGLYGTTGTALDSCLVCHQQTSTGGRAAARNAYGSAWASAGMNLSAFRAIEGADSDGDTFTNIVEINARTFPGDPNSKPATATNRAPTANAGPDQTVTAASGATSASVTLSGSGSDPDGDTITYRWTGSTLGTGVTTASATVTLAVGTHTLTLTVTDSKGATGTDTVVVTVNAATATGGITVMPIDGAVDVPVNTVVSGTLTGTGNIVSIFNAQTFTLMVKGLAPPDSQCVAGGLVKGAISYNGSNTAGTFTPTCPLANGTVYTAAIASSAGGLSASKTWDFKTIAASPDTDDDGVPDNEDDHPGNKGKGTPPSSRGHGKFLIDVADTAGASLAVTKGMAETDASLNQAGMPSGYEFPDGLVSYQVIGVVPGSTITVKVTFPSGIPAGSKVYKVGPAGFKEFGNPAIQGNTVTLTLTDGGAGDSDGVANGVIVDPVGVAVPAASGTGSVDLSSASGGGGCSIAVRTGSGASAIDGTLILAGLGLTVWGIRIRRRRG